MKALRESLLWRYAVKTFDPAKKLSEGQLDALLDAIRLAPSSYGLQPYKVVVVTSPELRAKLRAHARDQAQVTDASHLLVFCARRMIDEAHVRAFADLTAKERGLTPEKHASFLQAMLGSMTKKAPEEHHPWARSQAYIALGFLLFAAAHLKIDACPMEGFDAAKVTEDLGVGPDWQAVALCPVGFRDPADPYAARKKVRFPKEEFFVFRA